MDSIVINKNSVRFTKISPNAVIPKRHSDGAAGYDLCSIDNCIIPPGHYAPIRTGLFIDLDPSLFAVVFSRSGLSFKNGICAKASYVKDREEIVINLFNISKEEFQVEKFMRVAQMLFINKND